MYIPTPRHLISSSLQGATDVAGCPVSDPLAASYVCDVSPQISRAAIFTTSNDALVTITIPDHPLHTSPAVSLASSFPSAVASPVVSFASPHPSPIASLASPLPSSVASPVVSLATPHPSPVVSLATSLPSYVVSPVVSFASPLPSPIASLASPLPSSVASPVVSFASPHPSDTSLASPHPSPVASLDSPYPSLAPTVGIVAAPVVSLVSAAPSLASSPFSCASGVPVSSVYPVGTRRRFNVEAWLKFRRDVVSTLIQR